MVNIHPKTICFITPSPSKLCYCYIIQLKFICANVFLLNTIHSTRSPKAVHLTPRSIQCYHPPPPLHHLLQPEFKINTSNCKRHSCAKGNQGITTSHSLSNNPPPLVFIHLRITHNSFPKNLVIIPK